MYKISTELSKETLMEVDTEVHAYDVALRLASEHLGLIFYIHKGTEELARFLCADLPNPLMYAERAIALLNGGPLKDSISKVVLDALPNKPHWTEVH